MSTYLVTGGCGFIGSHLVESLIADGHAVRVLDDLSSGSLDNLANGVELRKGCVTDPTLAAEAIDGIDGCFHLAAISSVDKSKAFWLDSHRVNIGGMVTLLEAIARSKRKIPVAYASSAAVYGDPSSMPVCEDATLRPINAYGADKYACELHAYVGGLQHAIPTFGLRLFNIFGPRQDPRSGYSGVISIFLDRLMRGEELVVYGDGQQTRDFVYVSDAVNAFRTAMDNAHTDAPACNVATGHGTSILELAEMLQTILGKESTVRFENAKVGDIRYSYGNADTLRQDYGWSPKVDVKCGLKLLIEST